MCWMATALKETQITLENLTLTTLKHALRARDRDAPNL